MECGPGLPFKFNEPLIELDGSCVIYVGRVWNVRQAPPG